MELKIDEKDLARASSGNIEKIFHGSSTHGYRIGIDWKVNSQSATSNSSNVTATVYIRTTGNGVSISSSATKDVSVTINGTKYLSTCTVGIGTNSKKNLLSKTVTVGHNSDGTKTCSFACALDINVTLSGTYYGKITHSGNGTFNTINLNSAPTMGGSVSLSPSGTIPENQSSLRVSWNKASDAQNNATSYQIYRYVNGGHNATFDVNNINQTYYDDNISGFGQGTQIYYKVWARDSYGLWSNEISSGTVTKNRFTGAWFTGHSNDVAWNTTQFTLNIGGASNTNGNGTFKYRVYSDDVTIHNQRDITTTSETVKIWKTGETVPTTPYIKFDDLKNRFRGSSFNGRLHVGVRTTNAYGTQAWSGGSIGVDLRTTPTKPDSVTISGGTALKTIATTGNKYYIPNGTDTIVFNWTGGADKIGESHQYRIYQILDGVATVIATVSGSTKSHTVTLPKQSSTKTLAFGVHTLTSYGYTDFRDSGAVTLHYYNPPTVDVIKIDRTDTTATAKIKLNANTSIPNVNFPTRSYTGASSGTLTNTREEQSITASNLSGGSKYTWTVTVKDDTGLHSANVTKTIEIPAYTPLFSVREKGVGINAIPDGSAGLIVKKGAKVDSMLVESSRKASLTLQTNDDVEGEQGRVIFKTGSTAPQGVQIRYNAHDNTRAPFGLHIEKSESNTSPNLKAYLEVEGEIYSNGQKVLTGSVSNINSKGNLNAQTGRTQNLGDVYSYNSTSGNTGMPTAYTSTIGFGRGTSGTVELCGEWTSGQGLWFRALRDTQDNWFPWQRVYTTAYKPSWGDIQGRPDAFNCSTDNWYYRDGRYNFYFHHASKNNGSFVIAPSQAVNDRSNPNWTNEFNFNPDGVFDARGIKGREWIEGWTTYTRTISNYSGNNLDITTRGNALALNCGSASGVYVDFRPQWSGSKGTEPSFFNTSGNGWGYLGGSGFSWYRVYGAGGSVSDRNKKYDITKADCSEQYENVKHLNLYNYRTISDRVNEETKEVEEKVYRQDLMLGTMVDELPTETVFYDNESGDGKAVDMYSYTSMILGATKHLIDKVETLEKENELKDKKIEDLEQRLEKMEELLNGIINEG